MDGVAPPRPQPNVRVLIEGFSPSAVLDNFTAEAQARGRDPGALASFVGYCRVDAKDGVVTALELDHYPGFTENTIRDRVARAMEAHALLDCLVIHRAGRIAPREPIVLVAALARHRAAAFKAVEELMDWLKTDAPFWKREHGATGARWIEPTEEDRARRAKQI